MRLDQYQWSHNPRGMHNKQAFINVDSARMASMKLGWVKLVAGGYEYDVESVRLLQNNITPIVRIWRPRFGYGPYTNEMVVGWAEYIKSGVRWFEYYNEPNLSIEWPDNTPPDYNNIPTCIAPLMQNWLSWAELIITMGGYPAFPALSESVGNKEDVTSWLLAMFTYLAENYYDRFRLIANSGMWFATHPYFYNHYYQEASGPLTARPPDLQRAEDGGWHFEYPYDPLTQADQPGLTAVSGPPKYPRGDPIGLTGMGQALIQKFQEMFGGGAVPVIGTEGGITPVPANRLDSRQLDNRFPAFNWFSHGEATLACFNWIAQQAPPWMFGLTVWKEDEYFEGQDRPLRAVQRMIDTAPYFKLVPPIEALGGPGPLNNSMQGPGPIHGTPDYHFLLVTPGFDTNWFFGEAREYWDQFRPTIVSSLDFISYIPYQKSLAVTVLATPDLADYMTQQIKGRWPTVWFDLIVAHQPNEVANILRKRAAVKRRFG